MKCDPTLYRGAPPSLAVKPRLLRHFLLPLLIILLTIGLGYAGYRISEHFGIYATLWSYAVTLIVGGVICQMWAPETSLKHRKKESTVMEGQTQA